MLHVLLKGIGAELIVKVIYTKIRDAFSSSVTLKVKRLVLTINTNKLTQLCFLKLTKVNTIYMEIWYQLIVVMFQLVLVHLILVWMKVPVVLITIKPLVLVKENGEDIIVQVSWYQISMYIVFTFVSFRKQSCVSLLHCIFFLGG
jgi:hypothetical protein